MNWMPAAAREEPEENGWVDLCVGLCFSKFFFRARDEGISKLLAGRLSEPAAKGAAQRGRNWLTPGGRTVPQQPRTKGGEDRVSANHVTGKFCSDSDIKCEL